MYNFLLLLSKDTVGYIFLLLFIKNHYPIISSSYQTLSYIFLLSSLSYTFLLLSPGDTILQNFLLFLSGDTFLLPPPHIRRHYPTSSSSYQKTLYYNRLPTFDPPTTPDLDRLLHLPSEAAEVSLQG